MRIIVKISGESLKDESYISNDMLEKVYNDLKLLSNRKNEIIVVIGGGNFWRGRNKLNISNVTSDQIGMLATNMNALALNSYLNSKGLKSVLYSSFLIEGIVNKYQISDVLNKINDNLIIIGGGLGIPNFSTDMTVVEKAIELDCDMIIMAKNIDGIYTKDPKEKGAVKLSEITHEELLNLQLINGIEKQGVMDFEALATIAKHKIPLYLYNAKDKDGLISILNGNNKGTTVVTKKDEEKNILA